MRKPRITDLRTNVKDKEVKFIGEEKLVSFVCDSCGTEIHVEDEDTKSIDCPKCGLRYIKSFV